MEKEPVLFFVQGIFKVYRLPKYTSTLVTQVVQGPSYLGQVFPTTKYSISPFLLLSLVRMHLERA